MKTWNNTLLSITTICYLAVSSIAAVHAFPSAALGSTDTETVLLSAPEMSPECHQKADNESSKSASICKIFCAAMSSMIANDKVLNLPISAPTTKVAFRAMVLITLESSVEPHPPKTRLI